MKYDKASEVESIVWQMKLADFPRAKNRSRINDLFNGFPPFSDEYTNENPDATNISSLEPTKIAHDARRQYFTGLISPDPLFSVSVDTGPKHKRREAGDCITKRLCKVMKGSPAYFELQRSVGAMLVLHGIGPSLAADRFSWCQEATGIEDVLIPANTRLTLKDLPFFAVYRPYTGKQLREMTGGPNVDKGWDQTLAAKAIEWLDTQTSALMGSTWPEVWSPERMGERVKGDGGLYASDAVPTLNCWDFYFWEDTEKERGWYRRIVVDAWDSPGIGGLAPSEPSRKQDWSKGQFLYTSGNERYADKLSEIIHFQFADCSSVAPFRYHTVRSLGFLLFGVCHMQNIVNCKLTDAVMRSMMEFYRVANPDDAERASKMRLADKGIWPEGIESVRAQDRYKPDFNGPEMVLQRGRQTMSDNSGSFVQDRDFARGMDGKSRETATLTLQKANSAASLISSMLAQAYQYESFRYREICRRFCLSNSPDPDVKWFRNAVMREGISEKCLNFDAWDISVNRVIGGGNKGLQVAMADKLLAIRPTLGPSEQKVVDRLYIAANTDDYNLAKELVPTLNATSDSVHDAQLALGTLMMGLPVSMKPGLNQTEYIETLLASMKMLIDRNNQTGGMATAQELVGYQTIAQHIAEHIQTLAQDDAAKPLVKQYGDALGKMMNEVRAFAQRLQEQKAKAAQNGNGGVDAETMAKVQAMIIAAQTKAKIQMDTHAQKTAQKQIAFEQKTAQDQERERLALEQEQVQHHAALHNDALETAVAIATKPKSE